MRLLAACGAEYIVYLEGDDFWTDPLRLQKHTDFLDSHYECVMSSNSYIKADYENVIFLRLPNNAPYEGVKFLTARELIYPGRYASNASTCVYRKSAIDKLHHDFLSGSFCTDWTMNIMLAHHGLVAQLFEVMSVYRVAPNGVWSGLSATEKIERAIRIIDGINLYTGKKFNSGCEARKEERNLYLQPKKMMKRNNCQVKTRH